MKLKKKINYNDEINLAELILIIWKNKILIFLTGIIFAGSTAFYVSLKQAQVENYITEKKIKPISKFEESENKH